MAFVSSCPRCHQQVLVPDGTCRDSLVQCPLCSGEYALDELLATAPPALIVVRAGAAALSSAVSTAGLAAPEPAAAGLDEGRVHAAHRIEPTGLDSEPLDLTGEEGALAAVDVTVLPAVEMVEAAESPAGETAADPFAEPLAFAPEDGEAAEAAASGDSWGNAWVGDGKDIPEGEDGAIGLAEPEQAEGEEDVNFAAITGKPMPGSLATPAEGQPGAVAEPGKKKRRRRPVNPVVRLIGVLVAGLLAVPCALMIASLAGQKLEFLPAWAQFLNLRKTQSADNSAKPNGNSNKPAKNGAPAANGPAAPTDATPPGNEPAKETPAPADNAGNVKPAAPGQAPEQGADNGAKPDADANPLDTPQNPPGKGPEVAVNKPDKQPAQPGKAPAAAVKPGDEESGDPFREPEPAAPTGPDPGEVMTPPPTVKPIGEKPKAGTNDPGTPAVKSPLDGENPFAPPEKPKTEVTPEKPAQPAKPTDGDPFADVPAKPAVKPEPKPDVPPVGPGEAKTLKPDTPVDPAKGTEHTVGKPNVEVKPELPVPAKPESPLGPEPKPDPAQKPGVEPAKPDVKPDPAPKPELPKTEPKMGPLQAPSYPVADMEAAMKSVAAGGVDAKSYADWCKLAETITFAKDAGEPQRQAAKDLAAKVAANPASVAAAAGAAKTLLENASSKGGIVLAGKVTKVLSRNGLWGTAVRMEGMATAVMVFSARSLEVKEGENAVIFGALVSDPAKNLPGYSGKLPVVVWSDLGVAAP